jgi:hypothetical protein
LSGKVCPVDALARTRLSSSAELCSSAEARFSGDVSTDGICWLFPTYFKRQ